MILFELLALRSGRRRRRRRRPWMSAIDLSTYFLFVILLIMCFLSDVCSMSTLMTANLSLDVAASPSNLSISSLSSLKDAGGGGLGANSKPFTEDKINSADQVQTSTLKKPGVPFTVQSKPPVSTSSLKTFYGHVHVPHPLLQPVYPLALQYPSQSLHLAAEIGGYGLGRPPMYTRIKLGYGTFYFEGRQAELRCHFPYNLQILSNFVWNKMSDNLMHYMDAYRVVERTLGHTSLLLIRDVIGKDLGIYECAVTGSFYGGYPVTFYQEVHFYPVPNSPRRLEVLTNLA